MVRFYSVRVEMSLLRIMYIAYCYEALNEEAGRKQHRFGGEEKTLSNQAILKDKNMKRQLKGVSNEKYEKA